MTTTTARPRPAALIERTTTFTFAERADGPADQGGDGLTLTGHAAVFGQETKIDSWEGTFSETIRKGAFAKTLRERTPVLQFEHGRHPLIGSIPIGTFESLSEDDTGLAVTARLTDNWLMQPVRDAVASGAINGMSFRFEVVRDAWFDVKGKALSRVEVDQLLWNPGERGPLRRELVEVKVPELGPVVFPAYAGTDVSMRALEVADEIRSTPETVRQLRRVLALGLRHEEPVPLAGEVARALLFDLPDHRTAQLERIRAAWAARALTTAENTQLTGLLAQLAAADAALDPFCDALCAADMALDDATQIISDMLGVENPDPEEAAMPAGLGANSKTEPKIDKAAPPTGHPAPTRDAPPPLAPVTAKPTRTQYMRRAYLTREGVGEVQ